MIAFALSLSSTALILQVLAERGELTRAHGRSAFAILLFQDLAIMPALVILPLLAGPATPLFSWKAFPMPVAAAAAVVVAGRYALRPLCASSRGTRVQEAFTAAALLVVVGTALLFESVGLSMALGAFIAGVLLADSEYRHELEADIEPFKGLLLGLFFIAVGMSANLGVLLERPLKVLRAHRSPTCCSSSSPSSSRRASTRHDTATAWRLGVSLAGGGEFAFVLLALAARDGFLARTTADLLVIVVTLSMVAAPLLIAAADALASRLDRPPRRPRSTASSPRSRACSSPASAASARSWRRVLRARRIRFTALEVSQAQVDFVRRFGNKLYYGDASRLEMLRAAGAEHAELLVLAIDDVEASVRTAELAHRHFPQLRVLARARNRQHAFRLMDAGVTEIWRETFASSLEVAEAALVALGSTRDAAQAQVRRFRAHDEATLPARQR